MNRLEKSIATSWLPAFMCARYGAVSDCLCSTSTPIWRHWSTRKMPAGV